MNTVTNTYGTKSTVMSCMSDGEVSQESFHQAPLFGRTKELIALNDSYQRVKSEKTFDKVMVHGDSGTGKTSLVLALQESVLHDGGLFCSGKYFQTSGQDPYSAIMTAFSDLCDLVLQSDDFDEEYRERIEKSLGSDGALLVNAVSNISTFLGDRIQDENGISLSQQSFPFERFKVACKRFMRAMTSDDCTIVLFIDDIQWMDDGSRQLLEALLQDRQIKNFMLIMAYREEEAPLIRDNFLAIANADVDLKLGDLDLQSVTEMISERLDSISNVSSDIMFNVDDLCRIIAQKAHGNPFHILNFFEMIIEDGLLTFDDDACSWNCNLDEIQKNTMIPDSVAEIISKKIKRLKNHLQDFLKLLSIIGYRFTYEMILDVDAMISNKEVGGKNGTLSLNALLRSAMEANIIEKAKDGYQFTHDKLQAAFQEMLDKNEKEEVHLKIGTCFLKKPEEVFQYLAAHHLNCVTSDISNKFDNILLAKTNLKAARYCECRYAFVNAAGFLRTGIALLGDNEQKWLTDFDLSFELTETLAKIELILGNMDACIHANRITLHHAKSEKAKINSLSMEIEIRTASNVVDDAVAAAKRVLDKLGIRVPFKLTAFHLISKLRRVRKLIDSKKDEEILNLQQHADPQLADISKVILLTSSHLFQTKKILWVLYTTLLAIEYTLTKEFSSSSVTALCFYGICETIIMKNIERGYRLGRLALKLNAYIPNQDGGSVDFMTVMLICWHKERTYSKTLRFTPDHLNDALEKGNFSMSVIIGYFSFFTRFWTGEHLSSLEVSMGEIYKRLSELGQKELAKRFQPLLQLILNLRKDTEEIWEDLLILTGDFMEETEYITSLSDSSPAALHTHFWFCKTILAYNLGFYRLAEELALSIPQKNGAFLVKSFFILPYTLYRTMIYYARYRETGNRKYLHKARKCKKLLEQYHSSGNPNALLHLRFAEAEEFSLKAKNAMEVQSTFNDVIAIQAKAGFAHLEALANERASDALFRFGYEEVAKRYLEAAKYAYREKWGSTMKYEWLLDHESE